MSRISSGGNDKSEEQKRRESVLSVISEPNAGTVRSKKTLSSDGDSFAPSKHFDFRFTREKLLEIKRVFDAFDDNSDGIIDIEYLGIVLRASGLIITEKDIVDIGKEADPEDRGEIDLGKFFVVAARHFRDLKAVESCARKAFGKISKSNMVSGHDDIPLAALRNMLISRGGEQFVESEVEEFMKDVQAISDRKRGTVSVKALVQYTFGDVPIAELSDMVASTTKSKSHDGDSIKTSMKGPSMKGASRKGISTRG